MNYDNCVLCGEYSEISLHGKFYCQDCADDNRRYRGSLRGNGKHNGDRPSKDRKNRKARFSEDRKQTG